MVLIHIYTASVLFNQGLYEYLALKKPILYQSDLSSYLFKYLDYISCLLKCHRWFSIVLYASNKLPNQRVVARVESARNNIQSGKRGVGQY